MRKIALFAIAAAALAACGGPATQSAASISYKGQFAMTGSDTDVAAAVRQHATQALAGAQSRDPGKTFGCWYGIAGSHVLWRCEGSLTADELGRARLRIGPGEDQPRTA